MKKLFALLSSVKLAIALLIAVLVCCVIGVTLIRGVQAGALIFSTLWFNSLLVLLVVNVAFCFFGRIRGMRLTLVSLGMILFHLSFVSIFAGIIYNNFHYFRGLIRLTEGESLPSGHPPSYDYIEHGRFFNIAAMRGYTTLLRMATDHQVDGESKKVAYEIAVGDDISRTQGIVYVTHSLDHDGFGYFRDREGYSLLVILSDRSGKELYGAFVPLQSLKQKDGKYLYTTGTKDGPGSLLFPQDPENPLYEMQVAYRPSLVRERTGEVSFRIWPLGHGGDGAGARTLADGSVAIGGRIRVRDHYLSVKEVRFWAGMSVRHEPGKPVVLASLWVGLGGMLMTFIGRLRKEKR